MATTITVLDENIADATFDLDYHMTTHMPLAGEKFTPSSIVAARVRQHRAVQGRGRR